MQTLKPVSESNEQVSFTWKPLPRFGFHAATIFLLAIAGFFVAIALSWLLGNSHVTELFAQLHFFQEHPPSWLMPPQVSNKYYLLAPTMVLFLFAQIIIKSSPNPKNWSRRLVASILLILLVRYFTWRTFSTLNLANPAEGIFSILILFMELLAMASSIVQLVLMFSVKNRDVEADKFSLAVINNSYNPTVDILIPTYNEPDFILKRTIVGCQFLDYPHKNIYLLDDTKRSEIKDLAKQLGCNYLTRPDNSHAKAGNLNHAIKKTNGELIVVFDADFVPTRNFLTRTVGFFQKNKVALVQTPQSFYNSDPIARNLGLEKVLTPEEEVFYRLMQPIKDGVGSVVCAGTSFVVRRSALQEVGNFVTESVSEDYFTGIRLSAQGYELVYLDEKLSAGLAAESITAHIDQRLRWARGTLQAFFVKSNPLTIPGLNLWQRLGHLEGLLHWFSCIPRIFFLFVPLICIFGKLEPFAMTVSEVAYIFVPYYVMQLSVFSWLNRRARSVLVSDLYSLVQAFPVSITVAKVMIAPFAKGFKVTPKGMARDRFNYNWSLALPMAVLLSATLFAFSMSLLNPPDASFNIGLFWSAYNLVIISVGLLTLLDVPKPSFYEWFTSYKPVKLVNGNESYWAVTQKLSEEGVEIMLENPVDLTTKVEVEIVTAELTLSGCVTRTQLQNNSLRVVIKFQNMSLEQHRQLIEMLYCRPSQWLRKKAPGELRSTLILLKLFLRPLGLLIPKRFKLLKA